MGTEVVISCSTLRAQLESEKSSLFKIDENIKKIVQTGGRFHLDRYVPTAEYPRNGNRQGGRNSFPDGNNFNKTDEHFGKRKETKTVFSRLSAHAHDSEGEDEGPGLKRARVPSAVSRELPTRADVLRAQGDDEQARTRNRRIFGSLLGTLQKFKQEEIGLQTKEEKRAQVERKIEEQARLEKEREQKERKTLFAEREHKKATIKALEAKMARVQEFEKWEESQKSLGNFILTRSRPHIYWLPKVMSDKSNEKLISSRKYHEKCMSRKREELQDELQRIEMRVLRPKAPITKENNPNNDGKTHNQNNGDKNGEDHDTDRGKKRDKFATDVEKDDSDGDDRHDDVETKKGEQKQEDDDDKEKEPTAQAEVPEESHMDTSSEPQVETAAEAAPAPASEDLVEAMDTSANLPQDLPIDDPLADVPASVNTEDHS